MWITRPWADGYHWLKHPNIDLPELVEVRDDLVWQTGSDMYKSLGVLEDCLWFGPLIPPELPKEQKP